MTSEAARIEHWEYKLEASEAFRDAEPTKVHRAIRRFEPAGKLFRVVTQNIDGLHQKAGTSRERVIELHGSNSEVECQTCHRRSDPDMHFETFRETRVVPTCHSCGGFLKLGTISFGQNLREADIVAAEEAGAGGDSEGLRRFGYLLKLTLRSLPHEKVEELRKELPQYSSALKAFRAAAPLSAALAGGSVRRVCRRIFIRGWGAWPPR